MDDITPDHVPVALARDMIEVAQKEGAISAFALVGFEDGAIWFDAAGHRQADLLWALERLKFSILAEVREKLND